MLIRTLMTNFKMSVRADCALVCNVAPLSVYKNFCSLIISGGCVCVCVCVCDILQYSCLENSRG